MTVDMRNVNGVQETLSRVLGVGVDLVLVVAVLAVNPVDSSRQMPEKTVVANKTAIQKLTLKNDGIIVLLFLLRSKIDAVVGFGVVVGCCCSIFCIRRRID